MGDPIYEVFIQPAHHRPLEHAGSVVAATPDMALILARENFLRRGEAVALYVVRRDHLHGVTVGSDPDFFARELDRSYREASGYPENARTWQRYRRKALTLEELVDG